MTHLRIENINASYGQTRVLHDIDLEVAPGEFLSLVGPSGCGKSTLLRVIAGLTRPDSGRVMIDGREVTQVRACDRDVAMVFQSWALYPHLTARRNLSLPLVMRRLNAWQRLPIVGRFWGESRNIRREIDRDAEKIAALLDLETLLDRKPGQLSGGQRQRVALGRALIRSACLYLMDEPLSNLDVQLRTRMRGDIARLQRRFGHTTVYVTHDQAEAMSMSDRVALMIQGRILQLGPPRDIYRFPDTIDIARFIGSPQINLVPAVMAGERKVGIGDMSLLIHSSRLLDRIGPGTPLLAGIRPEHLEIIRPGQDRIMSGRIIHSEYLGNEQFFWVRSDQWEQELIVRGDPEEGSQAPQCGDWVGVGLDPERVLIFRADNGLRLHLNQPLECIKAA